MPALRNAQVSRLPTPMRERLQTLAAQDDRRGRAPRIPHPQHDNVRRPPHPAALVRRDRLGRRFDLRAFHRDPRCATHADPLSPCSCRPVFRNWEWIADMAVCWGLLSMAAFFVWALATW